MSDHDDLVVITCANGRICAHLIPLLYPKHNLRLVVRSQSSLTHLKPLYPNAEVLQADLSNRQSHPEILHNATSLIYIGPSLHPEEKEIGISIVSAAVAESHRPTNRFKHFIYSSVLNSQLRRMPHHDVKRDVEEHLFTSGLQYTVCAPGDFISVGFDVARIRAMPRPAYRAVKGLHVQSAFVVLDDYAEVLIKVLEEGSRHFCAYYPLVSTPPVAFAVVARDLGRMLGLSDGDFALEQMTPCEAADVICLSEFGTAECGAAEREIAEALVRFYRERGLEGNPNTMRWILGREPTGHREWIARQLEVKM